ncbi:hypothetical protein ACOMHN_066324 [Nucella lapillus]
MRSRSRRDQQKHVLFFQIAQVSVSMNSTEAEPADRVQVTVRASPQSTAYLLAVDQSVLLLKSGNDITPAQVIDELKSYDSTISPSSVGGGIMPMGGGGIMPMGGRAGEPIAARKKRMIWWPYPVYYGGSDANQIFQNAGVVVLTDALVYRHVEPFHYIHRFEAMNSLASGMAMAGPIRLRPFLMRPQVAMFGGSTLALGGEGGGGGSGQPVKDVDRVRSVFPETWLWTSAAVGPGMAFGGVMKGEGEGLPQPNTPALQEVEHVRTVFPETWLWNNVRVSQAQLFDCALHYREGCPHVHFVGGGFLGGGMGHLVVDPQPQASQSPHVQPDNALAEVEHVRNVFPETWLWSDVTTGADGIARVNTTVPDTITSWVTSAFAVSPTTGLGVAPTTSKLRVFRPFFVTLNLPYSVIRGEQVVVQAIVFNYLQQDQDVRVTMAQSQDFANVVHDANGNENLLHQDQAFNVRVPAGEGRSVYLPIVPATLGSLELIVSAQSTQAADAVRRRLLVEAEGVPKEYGVTVLVDLSHAHTFSKTVQLTLPPNVVADSTRARVTAIGDLMGPTVSGLDSLLRMPTGCGEQTMIGMAPDVFVTAYLSATNQLSGELSEKAIGFMEHGYQRELTYQHKDGSFSAFGDNDDSGSMWLTAFVAKTFHQAKPYVFIDDHVIERALDWVVGRQNADGSFPEPGRVIHKNMQGGAGSGTGLTAFVVISLLENSDMQGGLSQRVQQAKNKAVGYLKHQLPSISDDYILAMATYALTLASDPAAPAALQRLAGHAVTKDGLRYWHKALVHTTASSRHGWHNPQAASSDVEMTSYALLTYAANNDISGGLDILKWVASQRNPRGGYSSTQDTILALQSLSEFARQVYSNSFDLQVDVTADQPAVTTHFSVHQQNALVLQSADLPSIPSSLTVSATGSGIALVQVGVYFNVEAEVEEPTFDVTVSLQKDTLNLLQIQACARWFGQETSGMAVMEVGVPSGFEVDVDTIERPKVLKRTEVEDRKVVLYFDEVGSRQVCTVLTAHRASMVSKSRPVAVRIYDYYEPDNQATTFYHSALLGNSSICDVCADCDCPASARRR